MKKICLFVTVLMAVHVTQAQWEPDVRLTNSPGDSYMFYGMNRSIAASGDTLHLVWYDYREGNSEIYYKRSIDGGETWDPDTRLTNDTSYSNGPSVSLSGSMVHVVWWDHRDGNGEIYYKRSIDGGSTWEGEVRLTNDLSLSYESVIAASGLDVHVVWVDGPSDVLRKIHYKHSSDGGISWGTDTLLTSNSDLAYNPTIAVSGSVVHLVWNDKRYGMTEIFYQQSPDGGVHWGPATRLTNDPSTSQLPSISVSGTSVHLSWCDYRDGNEELYYKRSLDSGLTWSTDTRLTNEIGDFWSSNIAVSGSMVHVVWDDERTGDWGIYYMFSTDNGVTWSTAIRLNEVSLFSYRPFIAVSGPLLHVAWYDFRDLDYEIYYKRNPTGGFPVGADNELTGHAGHAFSIYPNPVSKVLNIKFGSSPDSDIGLLFIDLFGTAYKEYSIQVSKEIDHYSIDVGDIPDGFYLLEIKTQSQRYFRKILIKK
ncbi:MAG: T9SS type A sorting domain-containing protein [Bacteroidales bacterium]|nr:T9SS type A sorting domain-containing protein [Bacteroidales bacterium]